MSGSLIIGAMPIGNDLDVSYRLKPTIENISMVVSETRNNFLNFCLRNNINFKGVVLELNSKNPGSFTACFNSMKESLSSGNDVLIVSNAGYPNILDNAPWMIHEISNSGFDITVIPGPSIAINAFAISALKDNHDQFMFAGNIPSNKVRRIEYLKGLAEHTFPMVFVTIPFVEQSIDDLLHIFGDRDIAVCIDITKDTEKVLRGKLSSIKDSLIKHRQFPYSHSLVDGAKQNIHSMYSEYTLVVSGKK